MKKFGLPISFHYGFECAWDAFVALSQAVRSGADSKAYLYSHEFEGINGKFSFDANGDIVGPSFVMRKIEKLTAVPVDD